MKRLLFVTATLLSTMSFAQKAEIFKENGKYGLKTDFGKELLPADYVKITKHSTDTLDFYLAHTVGTSEIYSYNSEKRDIYDEAQDHEFAEIKHEWNEALKAKQFYGYTKVGEKYHFKGQGWEQMKVKGMIGCKDGSGKYAVCLGGKPVSGYDYLAVDAKHRELVVVKTDTGWIALDTKMKGHYDWSFDEIHDSDIHPEAFIVKKKDKWGILSLDGSMNLPPSEIKNPKQMFDFDGASFAELERAYAVKRGGKWGIVNEKNDQLVACKYDNAYMIDDFAIEQHGLKTHAVVKDGGTWKFLSEKWQELKSVQFDEWIGVHGEVALVIKEGKVWQLDLKSFEMQTNLYFADYADYEVIHNEDGMLGFVGKDGTLIMKFEYIWLALELEDTDDVFIIAEKNGKGGLYDVKGNNVVPHQYEGILFLEKKNGKIYLSVGNEGESALAYWDKEKAKLIILSDRIYKLVTFNFKDKSFSAETMDGVFHKLDDNGKMIEE